LRTGPPPKARPSWHHLVELWTEARKAIELASPDDDWVDLDHVEALIKELDAIDPGSFGFRYSRDCKGENPRRSCAQSTSCSLHPSWVSSASH
jgi:hypothetical protein